MRNRLPRHKISFLITLLFTAPALLNAAADSRLLWREALGGMPISEFSAQLESAVAVYDGGSVKAFGASGTPLWNYKVPGRLLPFLTRSRQAASYVCRTNGEFIALNRAGMVQWRLNLNAPLAAPAVCGWDDRVFIFLEKKILCFSAAGQALWRLPLEVPFAAPPLLSADGGIIMLMEDKSLVAVSPFGEAATLKEPPPVSGAMPASIVPVLVRGEACVLVIYAEGRLEMYNSRGAARGNLTHLGASPLAAAVFRAFVAVQTAQDTLLLLNAETGQIIWRAASPVPREESAAARRVKIQFNEAGGSLFVLSVEGVTAFSREGEELWKLKLEKASVTPSLDNGIVYSGGRDWILSAYRVEGGVKNSAGQASLPALGRYGLGSPPGRREWNELLSLHQDREALFKTIAASITAGDLGEAEPSVTRMLIGIASDKQLIQTERIEALRLLGFLGSRETIPVLSRILLHDEESSVRAEAALSLGKIGCDPAGRALDVFAHVIETSRGSVHEPLLAALAAALGTMCRFSGPPVSERGVKLLVALAGDQRLASVQQAARRELDQLIREGIHAGNDKISSF